MRVRDKVRVLRDVDEPSNDHSPAGTVAFKGEEGVVERVLPDGRHPIIVRFEEWRGRKVPDRVLGLSPEELEVIE